MHLILLSYYSGLSWCYNISYHQFDIAIENSNTLEQFRRILAMEMRNNEGEVIILHPRFEKSYSLVTLGDDYSLENIKERILDQPLLYKQQKNYYVKYNYDIKPFMKLYKHNQLTGLQRLYMHWQYLLGILPRNNGTLKLYQKNYVKRYIN
jgi:hypothetical protein